MKKALTRWASSGCLALVSPSDLLPGFLFSNKHKFERVMGYDSQGVAPFGHLRIKAR